MNMRWRRQQRGGQRPRRAFTLVELLVALPLATGIAVLSALLLLRISRVTHTVTGKVAAAAELRHARQVLAHHLAPLAAGDVLLVQDSLIEFRATLGVVLLCELPIGDRVVVGEAPSSEGSFLWSVRAGDELRLWNGPVPATAAPSARTLRVLESAAPMAAGFCAPGGHVRVRRWRVAVGPFATTAVPGTPVQIMRRTRFSHYRATSGWWLGQRTFDGNNWDVVQPVAGPFLTHHERGVRFALRTPGGEYTSHRDSAASVSVLLRAPARVPGKPADSVWMEIAMRAESAHREQP
jgi:hypothetical protein